MSTETSSSHGGSQGSVIIIGCGPGGYATASYAAAHGLTVTIFEKGDLGGTCLNRGCIPTKVYCHAASAILEERKLREAAIVEATDSEVVGWSALLAHKDTVVAQLRQGIETLMAAPGITLVRGEARVKDASTVICNGKEYKASNIIIATGSHPTAPPIEGLDKPQVVNSTGLLSMRQQPRKLVIIGAGVIGMEMASAFNAFGTDVTVVEFLKECLPMADGDLAKRLRKSLEKRGVKFFLNATAKAIGNGKEGGLVSVSFEQKGKPLSVEGDTVLVATGRGANIAGLGLDEAGIAYDRHGITTDDFMETTVKGVYAIGDVNGRCQLAHAAEAQGRVAINHILSDNSLVSPRLSIMPWAVFTTPELAGIGPTDSQVKGTVRKSFYRANGKAVAMDATEGLVKLTTDSAGRIIACHVLGAHAADLVQEVAALINMGATVDDIDAIIHIHPTLQELL